MDLILGSTFEKESETSESTGDAAVSGIPAVVTINIAPANYVTAHLRAVTGSYPQRPIPDRRFVGAFRWELVSEKVQVRVCAPNYDYFN